MASCPHVASANLHPPTPTQSVYREDCTLCFDGIDSPAGIDVCLHCFNGGCAGERAHSRLHATQHSHPLAVNISRTRKRTTSSRIARDDSEPAAKISKLEIKAETDADRWDTVTDVKCFECGVQGIAGQGVDDVVASVLKANTFAQAEEVKAWELELSTCKHTLCLEQDSGREIASGELGQCSECELKENLWLCLTCGALGCGRQQMGGAPGNSHARLHGDATKHPVAVKLGSITAEGNADIYCYDCDDEKIDPELVAHLANWGIDLAGRVKTEKSMGEMQLEHNLSYDFSMMGDDGKQMTPLFGAGLTGLMNLGNSCYLASILQSLFAMPEFQSRYYRPDEPLPPLADPASDLEIQLRKLADGLLSDRYSKPDPNINESSNPDEKSHQKGLAPAMLKHLIGRGHAEFGTMRQQDAFELLLHILKLISRSQQAAKAQYKDITDPVDSFRFHMEQRLQCLQCKKVRYRTDEMENISVAVPIKRLPVVPDVAMTDASEKNSENKPAGGAEFEPVTLKQCLDDFCAAEVVELTCSGCGNKGFTKRSLFKTFPTILAINARRFEIVNWVPTKQDVPVLVDDSEYFDMEAYRSSGKQVGEEELLEEADADAAAAGGFAPNEMALEALMAMGFPRVRAEKALYHTGNTADAEVAMGWLIGHLEDADIDEPLVIPGAATSGGGGGAVDPEKIENLGNMGFGAPQARQALKETGGDMERAVDWLFSHPDAVGDFGDDAADDAGPEDAPATAAAATEIADNKPALYQLKSIVCHKGSSIHAGHYVAFIKKEQEGLGWVLFNDEKVAQAGSDVEAMKSFAYVYFFRRVRA